jgi:hypothetical protein
MLRAATSHANDNTPGAGRPRTAGFTPVHVRFGSKADFAPCLDFVRFTPESGH